MNILRGGNESYAGKMKSKVLNLFKNNSAFKKQQFVRVLVMGIQIKTNV